jgi:multisubunit Na+/H+ antiporter MnhC subunit
MVWGVVGFVALAVVLFIAIRIYKNGRVQNENENTDL